MFTEEDHTCMKSSHPQSVRSPFVSPARSLTDLFPSHAVLEESFPSQPAHPFSVLPARILTDPSPSLAVSTFAALFPLHAELPFATSTSADSPHSHAVSTFAESSSFATSTLTDQPPSLSVFILAELSSLATSILADSSPLHEVFMPADPCLSLAVQTRKKAP